MTFLPMLMATILSVEVRRGLLAHVMNHGHACRHVDCMTDPAAVHAVGLGGIHAGESR